VPETLHTQLNSMYVRGVSLAHPRCKRKDVGAGVLFQVIQSRFWCGSSLSVKQAHCQMSESPPLFEWGRWVIR
jgi:hypothetical protein